MRRSGSGGTWIVRVRTRGEDKRLSLGRSANVDADTARARARRTLAAVALDGLPKTPAKTPAVRFETYVDEFWRDYARHWKPSTIKSTRGVIRRHLVPAFGKRDLAEVTKADVVSWRDSFAGSAEGTFNRAVPVLSVMFNYAEQLGYRRHGSNPCRGIPRYKRQLPERYLSPAEYRRLTKVLDDDAGRYPLEAAIVRMLLFTGARSGEITGLQWPFVQPQRLMLPDSKTGPKIIYLNSQAEAVLAVLPRTHDCPWVFPAASGAKPRPIDYYWTHARRRAAIPDVRLHDLRHSFASTAITDGVPLATIGKLLGHALPETTARYAHLADEVIADAAERVSGSLARCLGLPR